jgi:hypothetical protein
VGSKQGDSWRKEIHTFCDASEEGFGYAVYERKVTPDGTAHVSLIYAKARLVPNDMLKQALKDQENHHGSIPRLELVGAHCGAESSEFMRSFSPGKYAKAYWWAVSECVLKWIRDTKTRFKTFVHNRLATIHDVSEVEFWRYVPCNLNPADVCSHGLNPGDAGWELFIKGWMSPTGQKPT